jgi:glutamine amidotransferase
MCAPSLFLWCDFFESLNFKFSNLGFQNVLAIVDYGMANLRSVQKAFERGGHAAQIVSSAEEVRKADRIVVPGVGAFADAIVVLKKTGLAAAIKEHIARGRPMLGICLGLQLLFEVGHEDGTHEGMGVLGGEVKRFTVDAPPLHLKVPHMGWNALQWEREAPLFKGLSRGSYVYFVHSYHAVPKDARVIASTADYGGAFTAAIWKENIFATQFHPEKSQQVGGVILNNFATI